MKKTILFTLAIILSSTLQAQKVVGYIDANLNEAGTRIQQIHWTKLTDFIYGFVQPDGNGNLPDPTTLPHFSTIKTYCEDNGVNMHFSSGGATFSSIFNTIGNSQTAIDNYAKEIADLLQENGLTGWDLDWEFPRQAAEQTRQLNILKAVHDEFVARGKRDEWTIAIAVGGETPSVGAQSVYHTDYCNPNVFQYLDYLNVMSYDIGYNISGNDYNHSSYADAQANVIDWVNKGCPIEKIVLGVPFYARHQTSRGASVYAQAFSNLSSADPAAAYNSNNVGSYYYNGKDLLQQKTEYIMDQGGAGIMIWEVTYDRFDQYSLLDAIADAMIPYQCSAAQPDLGSDITICGSSSVTLNSGVNKVSGRTFTWKKGTQTLINEDANKNTYAVTQPGTYTVSVNENGCSNTDEIEVLGDLPMIDLGGDQDLCKPSILTLDAGVSGNVSYNWEKDGMPLLDDSKTLDVLMSGTYKITVSDNGGICNSVNDQVTITSSLIDATGASICNPGTADLMINENNGNYSWFTTMEDGSSVATGQTYSPSISQSTYYYIEVEVTGGANCAGLPTYVEGETQASSIEMIWEGEKWQNKWWVNKSPSVSPSEWTYLGPCSGVAACDRTPVLAEIAICTGVNNEFNTSFEVSPNPTNSSIKIEFNNTYTGELYISNLKGQLIHEESISNASSFDIDASTFENGMYILQLQNSKTSETMRFIKQ